MMKGLDSPTHEVLDQGIQDSVDFGEGTNESERLVPTQELRTRASVAQKHAPYLAGLIALGPWAPVIAVILSFLLYLVTATRPWALVIGVAGAAAFWLLGAIPGKSFARPGYSNPSSYRQLRSQTRLLRARAQAISDAATTHPSLNEQAAVQPAQGKTQSQRERASAHSEAHRELTTCRQRLETLLRREGPEWILGSAYVDGWTLVSRGEEALMIMEPPDSVLRDALYDKSRLEGSTIDARDHLLAKLRSAAVTIIPAAAESFDIPRELMQRSSKDGDGGGNRDEKDSSDIQDGKDGKNGKDEKDGQDGQDGTKEVARVRLRDVRRRINDFRAERWEGLIRERNHLLIAMIVVELLLFLLLALAAISGAPTASMLGAGVVFLVGALVGLFNRLYAESKSKAAADAIVDDYGLSVAKLMLVPLLAGLSALGGVLLMLTLYGAFIGQYIQPPQGGAPTPAATATMTSTGWRQAHPSHALRLKSQNMVLEMRESTPLDTLDTRDIAQIYNLEKDPYALLLAAVFGLAPGTLIDMLRQQASRYQVDLKSSAASVSSQSPGN